MTVHAYRITQSKHVATAFDGEGARLHGGRWNSVGTRVVYTAGSLSLATLELLVHTEDYSTIFDNYTVIPVMFDEARLIALRFSSLPDGWDSPLVTSATQVLGDQWVAEGESAVLRVPSAVTKSESNYLLNPAHPGFAEIGIGVPVKFALDPRFDR